MLHLLIHATLTNPCYTYLSMLKLLINSKTHEQAPLANKPLCFYTALIEYCAANVTKAAMDKYMPGNMILPLELTK